MTVQLLSISQMSAESQKLRKWIRTLKLLITKKKIKLLRQKERTFITNEKDWANGDDSDYDTEYVNLALMAKTDDQKLVLQAVR